MKQSIKRNSKSLALHASLVALLGTAPMAAQACGGYDGPYIGTICTFAFNWCPEGYLPADGKTLPINQYQALAALLGSTYGGDGRTTFALPDLRGRVVVGSGSAPGLTPVQFGKASGAESVTLVANNLPAHTHPASVTGGTVSGTVSLPLSGASVTGQTISGTVTVNALNGDNPPAGGVNIPTSTANTVGKTGSVLNFYPPGTNKVAVPTTHDLAVSGGTVTGNASGTVNLPIAGATLAVGPNVTASAPVATIPPRLGQTVCIASVGAWPSRD